MKNLVAWVGKTPANTSMYVIITLVTTLLTIVGVVWCMTKNKPRYKK